MIFGADMKPLFVKRKLFGERKGLLSPEMFSFPASPSKICLLLPSTEQKFRIIERGGLSSTRSRHLIGLIQNSLTQNKRVVNRTLFVFHTHVDRCPLIKIKESTADIRHIGSSRLILLMILIHLI
jgi:hypothetical protein